MIRADNVIIAPIVTEKTVAAQGKYTFLVKPEANKQDVKRACEDFYSCKVHKVNVIHGSAKNRMTAKGRVMQKRAPHKKATVTLKDGATINFNDFK